MSSDIASSFVSSYKNSKNKPAILRRLIAKSTWQRVGDDILRYFNDGSILLERVLVNELQLFKSAD